MVTPEEKPIVNKVAQSGIVTLSLEDYVPQGERALIDLADLLYEGLILREKDFREKLAATFWEYYSGKHVAVHCSADAIIPLWAYMLVSSALEGYAETIFFGTKEALENFLWKQSIAHHIHPSSYDGLRVVIKGCGDIDVPGSAYMEITALLKPVVKSLMFGEACSTVPVYKKK